MTPFVPLTWDALQPVANHLWQSTLVVTACAALAALLRNNRRTCGIGSGSWRR
jgi:hypothetical protein